MPTKNENSTRAKKTSYSSGQRSRARKKAAPKKATPPAKPPVQEEQATSATREVSVGQTKGEQSHLPQTQAHPPRNRPAWNKASQFAAWYINTSEHLVGQALTWQEEATRWANNTPWAPLVQAPIAMTRQWVKESASTARQLWCREE